MKHVAKNKKCRNHKGYARDIATCYMPRATSSAGFTIVEMVVSVALFTVVVMLSVSSLISLIDVNNKARTMKTAMDNLNLVIDDMTQDLRLGSKYYCSLSASIPITLGADESAPSPSKTRDCPFVTETSPPGSYLAFRDKYGKIAYYRFVPGECIKKRVTEMPWSFGLGDNFNSTEYQCITPPDITIERLYFFVENTALNSGAQPRIIISVKGIAGQETKVSTSFNIMTSITQRLPHNLE